MPRNTRLQQRSGACQLGSQHVHCGSNALSRVKHAPAGASMVNSPSATGAASTGAHAEARSKPTGASATARRLNTASSSCRPVAAATQMRAARVTRAQRADERSARAALGAGHEAGTAQARPRRGAARLATGCSAWDVTQVVMVHAVWSGQAGERYAPRRRPCFVVRYSARRKSASLHPLWRLSAYAATRACGCARSSSPRSARLASICHSWCWICARCPVAKPAAGAAPRGCAPARAGRVRLDTQR